MKAGVETCVRVQLDSETESDVRLHQTAAGPGTGRPTDADRPRMRWAMDTAG